MLRPTTIIAILFCLLAIPSVPLLVIAFPPFAHELSKEPNSWGSWLVLVSNVIGFGAAAFLTYRRARYWLIVVILICGYVTLIATPPFIRLLIDNGFLRFTGLIWDMAIGFGGSRGFYLIWNMFVLPVLPALLIPVAVWGWWKTRLVSGR